jgi:hypothetical protein
MTTISLADSFVRTEAGKAEMRAHAHPLTRPARNLLLVIDASCNGLDWIAKVRGSTEADLKQLVDLGLLVVASSAKTAVAVPRVTVEDAVRGWTYDALYTLLTHEAKERFGLIKGYRLILKIEGCANLAGLQEIALEFVEQIRKANGEDSATRFRKQLGATD